MNKNGKVSIKMISVINTISGKCHVLTTLAGYNLTKKHPGVRMVPDWSSIVPAGHFLIPLTPS